MTSAARWLALGSMVLVAILVSAGHAEPFPRVLQPDTLPEPDAFEPDDSVEQAALLLLVGIPQRRNFHSGTDNDWVYFWAEAGERVVIYTQGDRCDTYLYLYAPDATTVLAQNDDGGQGSNAAIRFIVPASGRYYARVHPYSPASAPCASYELVGQVAPPPAADAYEPDNSPGEAKPLPLDDVPQDRSLHAGGDQDWVTFSLARRTAIRLATEGPCDTYLYLYAADGQTVLAEDDDSGPFGSSVIEYTAVDGGVYYARVRHFDEALGACDFYQLRGSLIAPTFPDAHEPDDSPAQAKPLTLDGRPQTRSFHLPRDNDWVSLRLATNDRVFLFTEGPCDTYLSLYGSDGRTILAEDDDSGDGLNAAILYRVPESGIYYVRLRQFGESPKTCASYQLTGAVISGATPTPRPTATSTATPSPRATATPTRAR